MDLAELGIVFTTEGADAAIAKMEQFQGASAEVVQTDEERIKSAGKLATATDSLSNQITRSIIAYNGSKAAAYEFQAIAMGVNDQLAEQIELLKTLEQMEKLAISTAKELAAEERAGAVAAKQAAVEAEKAERAKWDAIIANAEARARDIKLYTQQEAERVALAKKTEQDIADAKNKALLKTMDERQRMIDLYTKQEKERVAEEAKSAAAIAASNKKAADDALKQAEAKAIAEISWAKKSRDEQLRIKKEIAEFKTAGISDDTIAKTFGPAAMDGAVNAVATLADKWNHVTLNTSRARSEMVVLAHEAVQGRFSRIPASMMVFAEYTDITALALSGMGLALMGVIAAIAAVSIAMVKGMLEQRELQNALIMTGNYAGASEAKMHDFAKSITASTGNIEVVNDVLADLAATGKFTFDQMQNIAVGVKTVVEATGGGDKEVNKLTDAFKSLAVEANAHSRYSDEVSKQALKLDNQYHFLTASIYANLRALEAEGNTKQASIVATNELARVLEERGLQMRENLSYIEKGWRGVTHAITQAWHAMKDWGRVGDLTSNLKDAAEKLKEFDKPLLRAAIWASPNGDIATQKANATREYLKLQEAVLRQEQDIAKKSEESRIQNEANNAIAQITLFNQQSKADKLGLLATKQEEYNNQLERMRKSLALDKSNGKDTSALEAMLTDDYIAKYRASLEKQYGEKKKAAKEHSVAALDAVITDQNAEFAETVKHTNNQIGELDRKYSAAIKLENDRFSVARTNAASESELGFASANEYIEHYTVISNAARQSLAAKLALLDEEGRAGDRRTVAILDDLNKQVAATTKGEEAKQAKIAKIAKAYKDQSALHKDLQDQKTKASAKADNEVAQSFSEAMKVQNADIEKHIGMQEKKNEKIKEEIFALSHTKAEVELLRAANEQAYVEKLEQSIALNEAQRVQVLLLMDTRNLTDKEFDDAAAKLAIIDAQINKSKTLLQLKKEYKDLLTDKSEAEAEAARIKGVEENWKKSWEATNKFAHDAFIDWAENGGSAAKKIGDTLKRALLEAIYAATLKPIIFNVVASVVGGASDKSRAEAEGGDVVGLGKLTNGGISYLKDALGITAFSGAASSGYALAAGGNALATFNAGASMVSGATGLTSAAAGVGQMAGAAVSGIQAGVTAALQAIPGWGWAAMAVLAIASMKGTYVQSLGESVATVGNNKQVSLGGSGGTNDVSIGGGLNIRQTEMSDKFVSGLASAFVTAAGKLGIATTGASFGAGFNDSDGGKFGITSSAGGLTYKTGDIKTTEAAMQLEASRAVFFALQSSDLPGYLSKVFDGITASNASQEDIDAALSFASGLKELRDSLTETSTPLQILQANVDAATVALGTTATTFKTDFVAAIDAGISPDKLAEYLQLSQNLEDLATATSKTADAVRSLNDIANERAALDERYAQATMTEVELADRARNAIDESNRARYDEVLAVEKTKAALIDSASEMSRVAGIVSSQQTQLLNAAGLPVNASGSRDGQPLFAGSSDRVQIPKTIAELNASLDAFGGRAYQNADAAGVSEYARSLGLTAQTFQSTLDKLAADDRAAQAAFSSDGTKGDDNARYSAMMTGGNTPADTSAADAAKALLEETERQARETKAAADEAAKAIDKFNNAMRGLTDANVDLQIKLLEAQGDVAGAKTATRNRDIAKLTEGFTGDEAAKLTAQYDANELLKAQIEALTKSQQDAANATSSLKSALASVTDSLLDQVDRIRGKMAENSSDSAAALQARFAIATAQARAGDIEAAKKLGGYGDALIDGVSADATSRLERIRIQAQVAESLQTTAGLLGGTSRVVLPTVGAQVPQSQSTVQLEQNIANLTAQMVLVKNHLSQIQIQATRTAEAVNGNGNQPMRVEID